MFDIVDAGEVDNVQFTVITWCAGESLAARLRRDGPLPLTEACRLLAPCARALHEAHQAGLAHAVPSPLSIFLTAAPHSAAKMLDFELYDAEAAQAALVRLEAGLPPRLPSPAAQPLPASFEADLRALGAILAQALTGAPLSAASPISEVPASIAATLARSLTDDPAQRFQSLAELAAHLENLVEPGNPRPRTGPPPPKLKRNITLLEGKPVRDTEPMWSPEPPPPRATQPRPPLPSMPVWPTSTTVLPLPAASPPPQTRVRVEDEESGGVYLTLVTYCAAGIAALLLAGATLLDRLANAEDEEVVASFTASGEYYGRDQRDASGAEASATSAIHPPPAPEPQLETAHEAPETKAATTPGSRAEPRAKPAAPRPAVAPVSTANAELRAAPAAPAQQAAPAPQTTHDKGRLLVSPRTEMAGEPAAPSPARSAASSPAPMPQETHDTRAPAAFPRLANQEAPASASPPPSKPKIDPLEAMELQ